MNPAPEKKFPADDTLCAAADTRPDAAAATRSAGHTVLAAGHICLDITPLFPAGQPFDFKKSLTPGTLLHMDGVDIHTGGSAANTGLGFAKLGENVRILGKIGNDPFGGLIQSILKQHGITKPLLVDPNASTSYSVVLAPPGTDRIFLHDPGANDTYCSDDLTDSELEGAQLFHFGYPPIMKKMYENDGAELQALFARVKAKGICTSLDMAAVDPSSPAGKADWKKILSCTLPYVDLFLPSFEEILFMLDRTRYEALMQKADGRDITELPEIQKEAASLAETLLSMGAKIVVIKCGAAGLYLATADAARLEPLARNVSRLRTQLTPGVSQPDPLAQHTQSASKPEPLAQWAGISQFQKSFRPDKICSGTGAGDTCIAAFLTAFLDGESPEMCLKLAAAQGASCVEGYDAVSGLKTLPELKAKIAAGWETNA